MSTTSSDLLAQTFRVHVALARRDTWFPVCDAQGAHRLLQRRQAPCTDSAWGCTSRGNGTKCDQWRRRIRRLHRHGKVAQRQMQSLADRPQKWREDRWKARDRRASISSDASADLLLLRQKALTKERPPQFLDCCCCTSTATQAPRLRRLPRQPHRIFPAALQQLDSAHFCWKEPKVSCFSGER